MTELASQLREAADENQELLSILAQTDYAPPALKQNTSYISKLHSQIAKTHEELKRLHAITEDERSDHVKIRDSTFKRLAYKMGGSRGREKYASKTEKEEREFLAAWQHEREAKSRREGLGQALEKAEIDNQNLEADKMRHVVAQDKLDTMYNSLFSGPTPSVPGEDQMEGTVKEAKNWLQQSQTQLGAEKHALKSLQQADQCFQTALGHMGNAIDSSRMDMLGGGAFTDMMERNDLSRAQNEITQGLRHMDEARRAQPAIQQLHDVNIDQGHFVSDVLFDNIFTDMAQHDRIKDSSAQTQRAADQLRALVKEQRQRVKNTQIDASQAEANLKEARRGLQRIRSEAFERLVGLGNGDPPPPY